MTTPRDAIGLKELGQRTDAELETMFGDMYAGWDRGVNVTQERFGNGDTRFTETPMTPLELAARYVAAEIGANIYEVASRAAFAPITVFSQIQARIGPVFEEAATALDALQARVKELEADHAAIVRDYQRVNGQLADEMKRALRAEQERDELDASWRETLRIERDCTLNATRLKDKFKQERDKAYERAADAMWKAIDSSMEGTLREAAERADAAIRRLAAGTEKEGRE